MYVRHFFKMLFWLIVMAAIGIGGLVLANHYAKVQAGGPAPVALPSR